MPVTINGTTGIAGVDGSAGTPAVQGTDTNTGIVFPAADTVAISTGGSERLRLASAGQLGIGGANYGTSGQVLTSGGASAAPSWADTYGGTAGQLLRMVVLSVPTDLGGTTVTNSSTTFTTAYQYTYTPLSSSSYILVQTINRASVSGSATDSFYGRVTMDGNDIGTTQWRTDTRISQWGPFYGRATIFDTNPHVFAFQFARNSADDIMSVFAGENNCYLVIMEYKR